MVDAVRADEFEPRLIEALDTSLDFPHHAARRVGIGPVPFFRDGVGLARPETEEFIRSLLERDKADIEQLAEALS